MTKRYRTISGQRYTLHSEHKERSDAETVSRDLNDGGLYFATVERVSEEMPFVVYARKRKQPDYPYIETERGNGFFE